MRAACVFLAACSIPNTQFHASDGGGGLDVNPSALALSSVSPRVVTEGAGDDSRGPVLVIEGSDISANATVRITSAGGLLDPANVQVLSTHVNRAGTRMAVPIALLVDTTLEATRSITLDVIVTQGEFEQKLEGALVLDGLDEYTGGALATGVNRFSRVDVTSAIPRPPTGPVIIEATSTVQIATANFDGTITTAGPGGNNGGAGGLGGLATNSPGLAGSGPAAGTGSTGLGNPAGAYLGDDQITSLTKPTNTSSGGGGGASVALGASGGAGGGGGGIVAITAGGSLHVASISARGGAGGAGSFVGGAGSGGIILLRGASVTVDTTLDVTGPGPAGRARVDAAHERQIPGTAYAGPMFVDAPLVVTEPRPSFQVRGQPDASFRVAIEGAIADASFGSSGLATITPASDLVQGVNELCVLVDDAAADTYTRNCVTVAYVDAAP